jgi:hypothetical protein
MFSSRNRHSSPSTLNTTYECQQRQYNRSTRQNKTRNCERCLCIASHHCPNYAYEARYQPRQHRRNDNSRAIPAFNELESMAFVVFAKTEYPLNPGSVASDAVGMLVGVVHFL